MKEYTPAFILLAALFVTVTVFASVKYVAAYNNAMVNCLAEHSKDICVETLR